MLKHLFSKKALPSQLSYEEARAVLEKREGKLQQELAPHPDAEPEMLYYIAEHGTPEARQAVAANLATPAAANLLLTGDGNTDVRVELARKVGRLLPDLAAAEKRQAYQQTIKTLERLAADKVVRVRAILAEEIKNLKCVPQNVVMQLAHDVEEIVSAPILEYSPLLSDRDLLDVITASRAKGAIAAVARRRGLSEEITDAIVGTADVRAITDLLANKDARLREEGFERILEKAENIIEWHAPLAARVDLPIRLVRRIAGFVGSSLIEQLSQRHELDEETRSELTRALRHRLEREGFEAGGENKARSEIMALFQAGKLDEAFVESALDAGQRDSVIEALSLLAATTRASVEKVLASRGAKAVTALAWRAGLSMRVALKDQSLMLKLKAGELLPARGGVHYPLSEDDMRWQLSHFGISGK